MANDNTLSVELLRSHVVGLLSIGEDACLHVLDVHLDGECGVGRDGISIGGASKFASGHLSLGDNIAQGDGVA